MVISWGRGRGEEWHGSCLLLDPIHTLGRESTLSDTDVMIGTHLYDVLLGHELRGHFALQAAEDEGGQQRLVPLHTCGLLLSSTIRGNTTSGKSGDMYCRCGEGFASDHET